MVFLEVLLLSFLTSEEKQSPDKPTGDPEVLSGLFYGYVCPTLFVPFDGEMFRLYNFYLPSKTRLHICFSSGVALLFKFVFLFPVLQPECLSLCVYKPPAKAHILSWSYTVRTGHRSGWRKLRHMERWGTHGRWVHACVCAREGLQTKHSN